MGLFLLRRPGSPEQHEQRGPGGRIEQHKQMEPYLINHGSRPPNCRSENDEFKNCVNAEEREKEGERKKEGQERENNQNGAVAGQEKEGKGNNGSGREEDRSNGR